MRNLECDSETLAGPLDERVVAALASSFPMDVTFLEMMRHGHHGGVPAIRHFDVNGERETLSRFLTLYDLKSIPTPPFRPHFDHLSYDERVVDSISYLVRNEHQTKRALFEKLVPFASTQMGMCLDRAYVDLVCFDARGMAPGLSAGSLPIVLWRSHDALRALFEWDDLPFDARFDQADDPINVTWSRFVVELATSFDAFVRGLYKHDAPAAR